VGGIGFDCGVLETPPTIVQITANAMGRTSHQKVKGAISVEIRKNGSAVVAGRELETGLRRDVFELPAAEVFKEAIVLVKAAEEQIHVSILVKVPCRDT